MGEVCTALCFFAPAVTLLLIIEFEPRRLRRLISKTTAFHDGFMTKPIRFYRRVNKFAAKKKFVRTLSSNRLFPASISFDAQSRRRRPIFSESNQRCKSHRHKHRWREPIDRQSVCARIVGPVCATFVLLSPVS